MRPLEYTSTYTTNAPHGAVGGPEAGRQFIGHSQSARRKWPSAGIRQALKAAKGKASTTVRQPGYYQLRDSHPTPPPRNGTNSLHAIPRQAADGLSDWHSCGLGDFTEEFSPTLVT